MSWRGLMFLALLSACIPREVVERARDRDNDGYDAWQLGGTDCDDARASTNPGSAEVCGDGIDNDCDDVVDDDGTGASLWYPDLDGDGYAVDEPVSACLRPADHLASLDAGVDCDDEAASVNPGASETWYDGIDANCDGRDDYDQDGDGYQSATEIDGGLDCLDSDADVNPDASEVCGNRVDDDCDGTHNGCDWSQAAALDDLRHAAVVWADQQPTVTQVAVGDTNDDGRDDLAVGGLDSSDIFIFQGPLSGTLLTSVHPTTHISMPSPPNIFGLFPDLGDLNGDGRADLLLSNQEVIDEAVIKVFRAPYQSELTDSDVYRTFYGPESPTLPEINVGSRARFLGDFDDDGVMSMYASYPEDPASCYVAEGVGLTTRLPLNAQVQLVGITAVERGPDFDGDDLDDYVWSDAQMIRWLSSTSVGTFDASAAAGETVWDDQRTGSLRIPPADLDADGTKDIVAFTSRAGLETRVDVLFGPPSDLSLSSPRFLVYPLDVDDSVSPLGDGDWNGDGIRDLAVLDYRVDADAGTGQVWVLTFYGPLEAGEHTGDDADVAFTIPVENPLFLGWDQGDIDGDGFDDLVVGHLGFAWVIYGAGR